ncbi:MAG: hypothetical protein V4519_05025 [Patescibacteria group bacterium]
MTTVIERESSGTGVVVGILVVLLIVVLLAVFGLPYLQNRGTPAPANPGASINVNLPTGGDTGGQTGQ